MGVIGAIMVVQSVCTRYVREVAPLDLIIDNTLQRHIDLLIINGKLVWFPFGVQL